MKRSIYIAAAVSLLAVGISSVAFAGPRDAGSKIRGDYSFDSSRGTSQRATRSTWQGPTAPSVVRAPVRQNPAATTAQTPTNRRFSHDPGTGVKKVYSDCQPAKTTQAPTTRRYSYEPGVESRGVYRPRSTPARSGFSPVRDAGSKIRGDY